MTTKDFTTELFIRVDDCMKNVPNHSQAALWPSEVVTMACSSPSRGAASKSSTDGFGDTGFHDKEGDPPNLKVCQRGEHNERMLVETAY